VSRNRRGARPPCTATAAFRYRKEVLADSPPDVHAWHATDKASERAKVGSRQKGGHLRDLLTMTESDPMRKSFPW
jgi:hypothetical protein